MPAWLDDVFGPPSSIPSWLSEHLAQPVERLAQTAAHSLHLDTLEQLPILQKSVADAHAFGHSLLTAKGQHDFLMSLPGESPMVGAVGEVGRPAMRALVKALSEEGGATLTAAGKRFAGSGYAVADPAFTVAVKTPKEMRTFLRRVDVQNALDAGKHIGKWTDPETGITEINLSDVVPEEKAAQKLAAQRGEQSIGHLKDGEYQGDIANPVAPVGDVKRLAETMRQTALMKRVTEIPSTRGQQLAQAYESLPKNDPAAKASYDALNAEVAKQEKSILDAGYKIDYVDHDPYPNSAAMMKDVRDNKTLKVFKTPRPPEQLASSAIREPGTGRLFTGRTHADSYNAALDASVPEKALDDWEHGFITEGGRFVDRKEASKIAGFKRGDLDASYFGGPWDKRVTNSFHPYMTPEQNDRFRAVHDFIAHAGGGNQFGAVGEENAYRMHASTLSPEALPALASETRGQNSWVNFGPNAHLPVKERPFAEQKAALFPQHLLGDYEGMGLTGAPAIHVNNDWKPLERGVFDRAPEGGVPSAEYREPAPLPFGSEARPRAGATALAQQIATDPRVEARITSDMVKGMPLGGRGWYGLLPLRRYFEERQGPISFSDFNQAGAAGSARTSTHNELTNASILLYAKRHGISYEDARQEFLRRFPGSMRPTFMGMHGKIFDRAQQLGFAGPVGPAEGTLKIPNYYHNRILGASGVPLDTHEMRMIGQSLGLPADAVKTGLVDADSYNLATSPYHRVAARYGLHPDQVQAARWLGGGLETGLKSQPKGDFLQTLEDGLLYTARQRGHDESPKGLRSLWDAIAQGDDFFMPYAGEGGFPVGPGSSTQTLLGL